MTSSLARIASYTSPWEANVLKARLEAEGIPTFLTNEHLVSGAWMYSQAVGGVEVLVPESAESAAVQILEAINGGLLAEADETQLDECPSCGATKEARARRSASEKLMAVACFFMTGTIFPPATKPAQCETCGTEWHCDEATI